MHFSAIIIKVVVGESIPRVHLRQQEEGATDSRVDTPVDAGRSVVWSVCSAQQPVRSQPPARAETDTDRAIPSRLKISEHCVVTDCFSRVIMDSSEKGEILMRVMMEVVGDCENS